MLSEIESTEATWVTSKIFTETNFPVATPVMKKRPIFFSDASEHHQWLSGSHTQLKNGDIFSTLDQVINEVEVPVISPIKSLHEGAWATVIQVWEGTVLSVDFTKSVMTVKLKDRGDLIPEHTAEIDLQWVVDQDRDLVVPGSVFYWTMYKETKRGSISNSQEIRFRRLPNWTRSQLLLMQQEAEILGSKFSTVNRRAD